MTEENTNANNVANPADKKAQSRTGPAKANRPPPAANVIRDFEVVYGAEYADIVEGKQWEGASAPSDKDKLTPSVSHKMTGLALSGGGIRSASFCLGVLQAFNATGVLKKFRYLSTVSGGGYIGTSISVAMSDEYAKSHPDDPFPFGLSGQDVGETEATRHLRDNSRYLLQEGIGSALSALVIYLRGVVMNVIIVLPFLLIGAALLAYTKPDTRALAEAPSWLTFLPQGVLDTGWPLSILAGSILLLLLIVYAVGVSISPILKLRTRRLIARIATIVLILGALPFLFELHFAVLRVMFEGAAKPPAEAAQMARATDPFGNLAKVVAWATPIVAAILPFLRKIAEKAVSGATTTYSDAISKWTSRLVLILVAAAIPLLLWFSMLQLAYWAIGVTACATSPATACKAWGADNWAAHAPSFIASSIGYLQQIAAHPPSFVAAPIGYLQGAAAHAPPFIAALINYLQGTVVPLIRPTAATVLYFGCAIVLFLAAWLVFNVNSNSLHQLYRDRLGSAFLFKRNASGPVSIEPNDTFCLAEISQRSSLYHLINTALNLPGSNFANRRGRNADFFFFSRLFTGSEATGYVDTRLAENVTDGLNVGTAMAISGAAAAPNMGMASMRPLSATIALLNVRLGRWLRHPLDIVKYSGSHRLMRWWRASPGPLRLLSEAFFKSGADISERTEDDQSSAGFVFLTDGGHIENLGVYELLRRRCSLIVAVDAESDPDFTFSSLVQLERFARIDFGTRIVMDCTPIGDRSRAVSDNAKKRVVSPKPGPHVALGLIDYPPVGDGKVREKGALIYIKASVSGDESGYVTAYKAANPAFPQESTMEQLFSEEQFEVYRALGEHIGRRLVGGDDPPSVDPASKDWLTQHINELIPEIKLYPPARPLTPAQAAQMLET